MREKLISSNAEDLLHEILEHRNDNGCCNSKYWKQRFKKLTYSEDIQLRGLFKELIDTELIHVSWADNYPYTMDVLNTGLTYLEEKKKEEKQERHQKYSNRLHDFILLFVGAILGGIVEYLLFRLFGIGG